MLEKKGLVYLVILTILLIFFSLFFIHDIINREALKDSKTSTIDYPGNNTVIDYTKIPGENGNTTENIVDNKDRFRILEGAKEWSELKALSIFENSYFNNQAKIAPGVHSTYNFTVENYGTQKMKYDITFTEVNEYKVNMKYKLKLNGTYIAGDDSTWVDYTELSQTNRTLNIKSSDIYTIEWKWVDAPNDTEVGETEGAEYTLNVKAYAEVIE